MPVPFTRTDLLGEISDRELTTLVARVLHAGDADPESAAIARAQTTLDRYAARYVLDDDTQKGFLSDLTLFYLCSRVADIPLNRQAAYDETMRELRDIRDGKYPDLPLAAAGEDDGRWGSRERVCL